MFDPFNHFIIVLQVSLNKKEFHGSQQENGGKMYFNR
jgi:hypothetical protein